MENESEGGSVKRSWKEKFLPPLFGGLVGIILSQSVAFYFFYKNFELMANRDRLNVLRREIVLLKNVQSEFEQNTKLLVNYGPLDFQYRAQIKHINIDMIKDPFVREFAESFLGVNGNFYEIRNVTLPKEILFDASWDPNLIVYEVQFELTRELNYFYTKLFRINTAIFEIRNVFRRWGYTVTEMDLQQLKELEERTGSGLNIRHKEKMNVKS